MVAEQDSKALVSGQALSWGFSQAGKVSSGGKSSEQN